MPQVSNLTIRIQPNSTIHYATWTFNQGSSSTSSSSVKVGSWVTINSGATYYNGVAIPSYIKAKTWYVSSLSGDRAILSKSSDGAYTNINSPVKTSSLTVSGSGTTVSTSVDHLDHYEVKWYYDTGNGVFFSGGSSNVTETNATYTAPDNASLIKCIVTPVSETYTQDGTTVSYWTGTAVTAKYATVSDPPNKPSTPTVDIDGFVITATSENISDPKADYIEFVIFNNTTLLYSTKALVSFCRASCKWTVNAGGPYRVRCRSINKVNSSNIYSEWSDFASGVNTIPPAPLEITSIKAKTETSVYLEWSEVSSATSYEIEYATDKDYFDNASNVSSSSGILYPHYEVTGLDSGDEYFFRVRAVNDQGNSGWTDIKSTTVGKVPSAPTTWSSTTTAIAGETLTLHWSNNSEDGSTQSYATVSMKVSGVEETHVIDSRAEEDDDKTMYYTVDTSAYPEGTTIIWKVKTAGVTNEYGEWSIERTIDVYSTPTLYLSVTDNNESVLDTLTSFPFYISGVAGPYTQSPIGFQVTISADNSYETYDQMGNKKMIIEGEEVYSKYFDISTNLFLEISAQHVDLKNGESYTITCTVSMNSGLTASQTYQFDVDWDSTNYEPSAEIGINKENLTAYIRPYCVDTDGEIVDGVMLSVYRREYDGTFTEIAKEIQNGNNITVTDPHPALDYAKYRIISKVVSTGIISYYDLPAYPVMEKAIVIQWNETVSNFDTTNSDEFEIGPWSGTVLKLKYNIDTMSSYSTDKTLTDYIGRSYPVCYYGTQIGETATWNVDIPKTDSNTIYLLRRLAIWMDDVYVREPSGSGYWANVTVSFNQKHDSMVIPIEINVTRVSGGM